MTITSVSHHSGRFHVERGEQESPGGLMIRDSIEIHDDLSESDAANLLRDWGHSDLAVNDLIGIARVAGMSYI